MKIQVDSMYSDRGGVDHNVCIVETDKTFDEFVDTYLEKSQFDYYDREKSEVTVYDECSTTILTVYKQPRIYTEKEFFS